MDNRMIRCLLVSDGLLYAVGLGGSEKQHILTKNTFVRFAYALAEQFDGFTLFSPVRRVDTADGLDGFFSVRQESGVTIINGGDFNSVLQFYRRFFSIMPANLRKIYKLIPEHDVILLRLPSMNAFLLAPIFIKHNIPFCTYVVGDQKKIIGTAFKYSGFGLAAAKMVASLHSSIMKLLIRKSKMSFFLGRELMLEYGRECAHKELMFTSLVRSQDIAYKKPEPSDAPLQILFAGRLEPEKGVETLLLSIRKLVDDGHVLNLAVCGTGSDENRLKGIAENLEITDHVEFKGFVKLHPDMDDMLLASDIFVLPSYSEGIPKVLLEAMAKGVPVVSTNVGGIPEIVRHNENGLLVPPKSPEALADAIKNIAENKPVRDRFIAAGYEFIRSRTMEHQASELGKMIKEAV